MKKYQNYKIKPAHKHIIGNPSGDYKDSFWDLMEELGSNFEIENETYIEWIEDILNGCSVNVGDWTVEIDLEDKDTVDSLKEDLRKFKEDLEADNYD